VLKKLPACHCSFAAFNWKLKITTTLVKQEIHEHKEFERSEESDLCALPALLANNNNNNNEKKKKKKKKNKNKNKNNNNNNNNNNKYICTVPL